MLVDGQRGDECVSRVDCAPDLDEQSDAPRGFCRRRGALSLTRIAGGNGSTCSVCVALALVWRSPSLPGPSVLLGSQISPVSGGPSALWERSNISSDPVRPTRPPAHAAVIQSLRSLARHKSQPIRIRIELFRNTSVQRFWEHVLEQTSHVCTVEKVGVCIAVGR